MTVLFIIATQALGLVIFWLFPATAIIISIVSMIGSPTVTLSGVTFPLLNMYPVVRDAFYLFSVRHFTKIDERRKSTRHPSIPVYLNKIAYLI